MNKECDYFPELYVRKKHEPTGSQQTYAPKHCCMQTFITYNERVASFLQDVRTVNSL